MFHLLDLFYDVRGNICTSSKSITWLRFSLICLTALHCIIVEEFIHNITKCLTVIFISELFKYSVYRNITDRVTEIITTLHIYICSAHNIKLYAMYVV